MSAHACGEAVAILRQIGELDAVIGEHGVDAIRHSSETAANKGIEGRRIKLGSVFPGEGAAVFGDALRRLASRATYLYQDGQRYWYSTQPTVTKLAEDRAEQLRRNKDKLLKELVKPDAVRVQIDKEKTAAEARDADLGSVETRTSAGETSKTTQSQGPKRYHGTVSIDPSRVGRDAGRIAEEVISHLVGLVDAKVSVTIEIAAEIPHGTPDQVLRTVTENGRTLRFQPNSGFETD